MKIGVISDTHGNIHYFEKALSYLKDCDKIIHAGDILYHNPKHNSDNHYDSNAVAQLINSMENIAFVRGNCDSYFDSELIKHEIMDPYLFLEIEGLKIMAAHGYTKSIDKILEDAKEFGCHIFIYGHTHIKYLKMLDEIVVLNPGSPSIPRDDVHSVAIIENREIRLIDIENGGNSIKSLIF